MEAFEGGAGMSAAGLRTAIVVLIFLAGLLWLGWVTLRTTKLVSKGRLTEAAWLFSVIQALAVLIVLGAIVLSL